MKLNTVILFMLLYAVAAHGARLAERVRQRIPVRHHPPSVPGGAYSAHGDWYGAGAPVRVHPFAGAEHYSARAQQPRGDARTLVYRRVGYNKRGGLL